MFIYPFINEYSINPIQLFYFKNINFAWKLSTLGKM
jgi:hypothetical protein